jgi:hypothetical protein
LQWGFDNEFLILASTRITLVVILSGQDTRFFPERLTGAVGKGFRMVKVITNLKHSIGEVNTYNKYFYSTLPIFLRGHQLTIGMSMETPIALDRI